MKKEKKINRLRSAAGTYDICRCYFKYDKNYWYYYLRGCSEKLMLGVEEDDFILDGFAIRKISDLKKVEIKKDACDQINRERCVLAGISDPYIDLTSWKSVFESLAKLNYFLIIQNDYEDEGEDFFYIGKIKEVKKNHVVFAQFDADGVWGEDVEIPYKDITTVKFDCRYSRIWQQYLTK